MVSSQPASPSAANTPEFLEGAGEVATLLRALDWAASPLGDPHGWPQGLRSIVRFMLTTGTPVSLYWGREHTFLYNDAMAALIGRERHPSAIGRPGAEVWKEIWREIEPQIDHVMEGRGGLTHSDRHLRLTRDGSFQDTWWDYSQSPMDDPASPGGIGGVVVLAIDVTQRRRAREVAHTHTARLLSIFDNSAGFLALVEGPEHRFVLTNNSYLALVGREKLVGQTVAEALPEVAEQGFVDALNRVYETGEPFEARDLSVLLNRNPTGSPEIRRLNFVYHRVEDEMGNPVGIIAEGHDVTEIAAAKDALLESNNALNAILEYSPDLICALDEAAHIKVISASCRTLLGYEAAEMVGRRLSEIIHTEDLREASEGLDRVLAEGSVLEYEYRLRRRDGVPVTMRWAAVHSPELKTIYAVGRDVTEAQQKERQLRHVQKMEAVGRITAGVAHDFNNLLTVAISSAEAIIATSSHDAEKKAQAELILGSAERGAELVKRLLAFSRRQSLSPQAVDVPALMAGLKPLIERGLGSAIELDVEGEAVPALKCQADFSQLEAAIFNLCVNARDAMPEGGRIAVSARREKLRNGAASALGLKPGDYIAITVRDEGHGMSPEVLERAIEPFFTTKADSKGSGLGLSMVYGFVKQSGGQLTIASKPHEGTEVRILLPSTEAPAQSLAPAPRAMAPRVGAHILVVEDDDRVRVSVVGYLESLGYRVSSAAGGSAAVDLLCNDATIDLLFTDVEMPGGMNGRQLADASRVLRPDLRVLFTSGYTEDQVLSRGGLRDAGWSFLQKPYRRARLASAMAGMLGVATEAA